MPPPIPILVGLGVDELSVSVPAVPTVKAQVRGLDCRRCEDPGAQGAGLRHAAEVRELVRGFRP